MLDRLLACFFVLMYVHVHVTMNRYASDAFAPILYPHTLNLVADVGSLSSIVAVVVERSPMLANKVVSVGTN